MNIFTKRMLRTATKSVQKCSSTLFFKSSINVSFSSSKIEGIPGLEPPIDAPPDQDPAKTMRKAVVGMSHIEEVFGNDPTSQAAANEMQTSEECDSNQLKGSRMPQCTDSTTIMGLADKMSANIPHNGEHNRFKNTVQVKVPESLTTGGGAGGTIDKWRFKVRDLVKENDIVAFVDIVDEEWYITIKMGIRSPVAGVLTRQYVPEGGEVMIHDPLFDITPTCNVK